MSQANLNSVMNAVRNLNNELKEEHKSFTSLVKTLEAKKNSEAMKNFLNVANLKFEHLTNIDYFKSALTYATFESNGVKYEHIARKNHKTGEMVKAKWSFWLILNAAKKIRREELKAIQKVKEESLKAIEKEEKEVKEKEAKKTAKK